MGTSGVTSLTVTRNEIIEQALSLIRRFGAGDTLNPDDASTCATILNMMIRQWQLSGINISTVRDFTIFLETGKTSYLLGPQGDNATEQYLSTSVAIAGAVGDETLTLNSRFADADAFALAQNAAKAWRFNGAEDYRRMNLDGELSPGSIGRMPSFPAVVTITSDADESAVPFIVSGLDANGDAVTETITGPDTTTATGGTKFCIINSIKYPYAFALSGNVSAGYDAALRREESEPFNHYGIVTDDKTFHWDALNSMMPFIWADNTAHLNAALSSVVSVDNPVYMYHKKIDRPLAIVSARLATSTGHEYKLSPFNSKSEYLSIGNKTVKGTPGGYWYDPTLGNGTLHLWPTASNVSSVLKCQARMPIEIMDSAGNTAPFPAEWQSALVYNLALLISPAFGTTPDQGVIHYAQLFKRDAIRSQVRSKSIQIVPRIRR